MPDGVVLSSWVVLWKVLGTLAFLESFDDLHVVLVFFGFLNELGKVEVQSDGLILCLVDGMC